MRIPRIDCKRILEIDLERAQGGEIDREDLELYQEHLAECRECRMEKATLDTMAGDCSSGALPPLDDLSRRRFVDDVVARACGIDLESFDEPSTGKANRGKVRVVALASALIAASIAAFLFWWTAPSPSLSDQPLAAAFIKPPIDTANNRFSLLSGEVFAGKNRVVLGDSFRPGDALETGNGRAVIALKTGVTLSLGSHTDLKIGWANDSATEVLLNAGQIQVYVDPDRKLSGFSVVTGKGRVEVTGTIFSVAADDDSVQVRVLRGEVEIEDGGGQKKRLSAGGATEIGGSKTWTLSREEEKSLWTEVRAVEMLDPRANAVVEIESAPPGLDVAIDSVFLGKTPVSASIRAGYRQLAVTVNDRRVVQELVEIEPGSRLYRNFNLMDVYIEKDRYVDHRSSAGEAASKRGSGGEEQLSAQELLKNAQILRASRDWHQAARAYEKLIEIYPDSDETRASFVSLGEIQLNKLGKPRSALQQFERYLSVATQGPLSQEALFGKARALNALGRSQAEQETLNLFLTRFPSAIQAGEAKARLSDLQPAIEK
jgi:hypothetical protein